jgi:hypothetical protein
MPFIKWVDTHVHYQRAPRLQAIMLLLKGTGPLTSHDVQARLARAGVLAGARMRVTIDTVQRDLKLLVYEGYLEAVDLRATVMMGGGRRRRVWRYGLPTTAL